MSQVNQLLISRILNSQIVGHVGAGHGQIDSMGDVQRFFDAVDASQPVSVRHKGEPVDRTLVKQAFLDVRDDQRSPDLYVADPDRNSRFLARCRKLGLTSSVYIINKTLINARKGSLLPGLKSIPYSLSYGEYAFASEFAATELRYKFDASIDDILCDPALSAKFFSIATSVTPGYSELEYRWGILSIRKAGRKPTHPVKLPAFTKGFKLLEDPIETIPERSGVYLLYERTNLLYLRGAERLRHGVELHRSTEVLGAINKKLWQLDPASLNVSYASFPKFEKGRIHAIENKLLDREIPIFNVQRSA